MRQVTLYIYIYTHTCNILYCVSHFILFQLVFITFNIVTMYLQYLLNLVQTSQLLQALVIKIYRLKMRSRDVDEQYIVYNSI